MSARPPRLVAWLVLLAAYAAALLVALLVAELLAGRSPLFRTAVADIVATIVVFLISVLHRNTSIYDPYWSVAPIALVLAWAKLPAGSSDGAVRVTLVLTLVAVWGLRLTWNFLRRWRGLGDEDWRYARLRERRRGLFPLVNLFGLQLMPTVLVFAALLPAYAVLTAPAAPLGVLDGLALLVTAGAIAIEAVADRQLRRFLDGEREPGAFLATGLWRWSRHPNYFGEVVFWWGLGLFAVAADPANAWTLAGPAAITLLFVVVSVPMMDRRMRTRPGYAEHCERTRAIVPWPPGRVG